MEENKHASSKTPENRSGSKDDWEALKIVLDEHPSLKQRVLHKMRELQRKNSDDSSQIKVSAKDQKDLRLKEQAKNK